MRVSGAVGTRAAPPAGLGPEPEGWWSPSVNSERAAAVAPIARVAAAPRRRRARRRRRGPTWCCCPAPAVIGPCAEQALEAAPSRVGRRRDGRRAGAARPRRRGARAGPSRRRRCRLLARADVSAGPARGRRASTRSTRCTWPRRAPAGPRAPGHTTARWPNRRSTGATAGGRPPPERFGPRAVLVPRPRRPARLLPGRTTRRRAAGARPSRACERVTARVAASRRDRLTARLPMLRPPHPEGLIGAVRVEVRGGQGQVDGHAGARRHRPPGGGGGRGGRARRPVGGRRAGSPAAARPAWPSWWPTRCRSCGSWRTGACAPPFSRAPAWPDRKCARPMHRRRAG